MKTWNPLSKILQKKMPQPKLQPKQQKKPLTPQMEAEMKEQRLSRFLKRGIALSSACLFGSLTITVFPELPEQTVSGIRQSVTTIQSGLERLGSSIASATTPHTSTTALAAERHLLHRSDTSGTAAHSSRLALTDGHDPDIVTGFVSKDNAIYDAVLETSLGPMIYYNQGDSRWRDYLYGGADPMHTYGCGPTAVAMLITSFSPQHAAVTPVDMANWAAEHGHYAPQGGSYRSLIQSSLSAFGFQVKSVKDRSVANASALLSSGHVLVALMGPGALTDGGHFIIITQLLEDGTVTIADPNNMENSQKPWDLNLLMSELKKVSDSGAPLWAVSL